MIFYSIYSKDPGVDSKKLEIVISGNPKKAIRTFSRMSRENPKTIYQMTAAEAESFDDMHNVRYSPEIAMLWKYPNFSWYNGCDCTPIRERQVRV